MKLPLSWLKDYVEIKESPQKLTDDLQFSGTKVEGIEGSGDHVVFDFEITPNRPDCLSVIGIAREVAAVYNRKLTIPSAFSKTAQDRADKLVSFEVKDGLLCPSYSVGVFDKVKVSKSPTWLTDRLEKSGIRTINNIVDISNYVMLETGQPMHAFDYDKISGKMKLRSSKEGEKVTTLDGIERNLPVGTIIIEDEKKLIDLAGLMGGESSEVDKNTKAIVLHVPLYDPLSIRRASQYLGLRTEASNRFEKKLDPGGHRYAFERAGQLISLVASGKLASPIESINYPPKKRTLVVRIPLIRSVLGIPVDIRQVKNILSRLEFAFSDTNNNEGEALKISIPTFRTDISEPIDIAEEMGRIYGYNKFPRILPKGKLPNIDPERANFETGLKQILYSLGAKEIYTSALTSGQLLHHLGIRADKCLRVANRLVIDYEFLRPTLLVGMIPAVSFNQESTNDFSLFEVGRIFDPAKRDDDLPSQPKKVSAILSNSTFTVAKGFIETIFAKLNVTKFSFGQTEKKSPFGKSTTAVFLEERQLGLIGEISSSALKNLGIKKPVSAFELDLEALKNASSPTKYKTPPKYPIVRENISLFIPEGITFSQISEAVKASAGKNFYNLALLEDRIVSGKRSLLLEVEFYSVNKTLNKRAVDEIRTRVLNRLKSIGTQPRVG